MERFRLSGHSDDERWFRVGTVDVTTTVLGTGLAAASLILWVVSKQLFVEPLVMYGDDVRGGQIWRLVTWPLVNGPDLWILLSIAMFFLIGQQFERVVGRTRYAWMLLIMTVVPAVIGTLYPVTPALYGLQFLTSGLFVAFALHQPMARSFFNLPLWALVAFFEAIFFLQLLDAQRWSWIVFQLASIATAAVVTRSFDLTEFVQIPKVPLPAFITKDPYQKANRARQKSQRAKQRRGDNVVPMAPRGPKHLDRDAQADMDRLLDKIAASGIDSLTDEERRRLDDHSRRLREQ